MYQVSGMGKVKLKTISALLIFLLVVELNTYISGGRWAVEAINCVSACETRCSKASRHKMCIRACNTCCQRCHCVPPGTSGHKDVCPCYANMKTHGGRPKCP